MSEEKKNQTLKEIIDLSELQKKEKITNSECILTIMEICLNSKKYKFQHQNSTRVFWEEVFANEELANILKLFKPETLRKYWRIIRDTNQYKKTIEIVTENASLIDNPKYKLLPVINAISVFIKSKAKNFEKVLNSISKVKTTQNQTNDKNDESEIYQSFLKNKRKKKELENDNIEQDIIKLNQKIKEKKEREQKLKELENEGDVTLEHIIRTFQDCFQEKNKEEIYQTLYKTSCNLKNTYLVLCNPDKYDYLIFENTDDYILQNLRDKSYYQQLIEARGKERISERETFLGVKKDK